MPKRQPLLPGQRFGRLVVESEERPSVKWRAVCLCDCGNRVSVLEQNLRNGRAQSCGCRNRELASERMRAMELATRDGRSESVRKAWEADDGTRRRRWPRSTGLTGYRVTRCL